MPGGKAFSGKPILPYSGNNVEFSKLAGKLKAWRMLKFIETAARTNVKRKCKINIRPHLNIYNKGMNYQGYKTIEIIKI